jgi:protein required for attachment to host cells
MKHSKTWIAVADGARAKVYEQIGVGPALTSVESMSMEEHHAPTRELGRDKPARVQESASAARHGIDQGRDLHEAAEQQFVKRFAGKLVTAWNSGSFDRLILVAAPRSLGYLRSTLPPVMRKVVKSEIAKDMTRAKPDEVAALLDKV